VWHPTSAELTLAGIVIAAALGYVFSRLTARANHRLALKQAQVGRILDRKVELYEQMVIWSGYLADRREYLMGNPAPDSADMPKSPFPEGNEDERARALDAHLLIISTLGLRAASKKRMDTDFKFDQAVRNWNRGINEWRATDTDTQPALLAERAQTTRQLRTAADAADAELLAMIRLDLGTDSAPPWWTRIPLLSRLWTAKKH
jgi:hypothetical protein